MKITSRDNQGLKFARKVRDEKIVGKIFIEGTRLAEEALRSNLKIDEVFVSENFAGNERAEILLEKIHFGNLEIFYVTEKLFNTISATKTSQGIVLIAQNPQTGKEIIETKLKNSKNKYPLLVLLHKINNPANLGAILRTAEAIGADGIILSKNSTSPFSPKALRAAMGASFRIPIWKDVDFPDVLDWARINNLTTVCADINAEKSYVEIDFKRPVLIVFGSEAHGLSESERNLINESVTIPLENEVESLNLAVACGVILFEIKRQKV